MSLGPASLSNSVHWVNYEDLGSHKRTLANFRFLVSSCLYLHWFSCFPSRFLASPCSQLLPSYSPNSIHNLFSVSSPFLQMALITTRLPNSSLNLNYRNPPTHSFSTRHSLPMFLDLPVLSPTLWAYIIFIPLRSLWHLWFICDFTNFSTLAGLKLGKAELVCYSLLY